MKHLCKEPPSRNSPSHLIQPWTLAQGEENRSAFYMDPSPFESQRHAGGDVEGWHHPRMVQKVVVSGMHCRAQKEDSASAEWFLGCRIPNAPRKQINWQWLENDWSMSKLWNSPSHSWVLQSRSGVWEAEILLSPSLLASAHLNRGNPFAVLIRKQLMPS